MLSHRYIAYSVLVAEIKRSWRALLRSSLNFKAAARLISVTC